jgi:hypothetical protein
MDQAVITLGGYKATCATTDVLARRLPRFYERLLKTAHALVRELGSAVQPPRGTAIVLTEEPGAQPNWVAAAGIMEAALTDKFAEKVAELRKTDPLVDWSRVDKDRTESRRVVKFLSATN